MFLAFLLSDQRLGRAFRQALTVVRKGGAIRRHGLKRGWLLVTGFGVPVLYKGEVPATRVFLGPLRCLSHFF